MSDFSHGGDVYRNKVDIDFSVNINPLGTPGNVKDAMRKSLLDADKYPDYKCESLKNECAKMLGCSKEYILFGNGSSEIFMAVAHALKPQRVLIPVPSFYGYEYAFSSVCDNIQYSFLKAEDDFKITDEIRKELDDTDCLILANPNNPTGNIIENELLKKILDDCLQRNITVVLDECFTDFTFEESMVNEIEKYPNLITVRSFTKTFAIPSVRIGFLVCSDKSLVAKVQRHIPEWNVSGIAQSAGCECAKGIDYINYSKEFVQEERGFLLKELKEAGIKTFDSSANFILIFDERPLYDLFLEKGILIRDCSNFRGLTKGYYRIAVRNHEENKIFVRVLKEILWK